MEILGSWELSGFTGWVALSATLLLWILVKIVVLLLPLFLGVAYLTYAERKVIGYMQSRLGPTQVGWHGLLQPIADVFKLFFKELVNPSKANLGLFTLAPVWALGPALTAWAVIPFGPQMAVADVNVGLLFVLTMSSMAVYGIILAGWASNSRYAFLGALRSAAQVVAYEIPMSFAILGVLMLAGSMNLKEIVLAQGGGFWQWYWLPLFPLFVIYFITAVAETNRAPFDVAEGESEIVAGFHVEYAGTAFAGFFLAEYANMMLVSALAALMFLGGWLPPFEFAPFTWVPAPFWFLAKVGFFLFLFLWFRATFPRFRYDQIMRLGWKVFVPVTLVWIVLLAVVLPLGGWE